MFFIFTCELGYSKTNARSAGDFTREDVLTTSLHIAMSLLKILEWITDGIFLLDRLRNKLVAKSSCVACPVKVSVWETLQFIF